MTLNYDFDVFSLIPRNVSDDPDSMESKAALFRDQATLQALQGAHPRVRRIFELAGFGVTVHDSGAGAGRIPERDRGPHGVFLDRVSALLSEEFSEAEIAEGVLGAPSVDRLLADGAAPEGAFVVLDWLNAAIAVQESPVLADFAEDAREVAPEIEAAEEQTVVRPRGGRETKRTRARVLNLAPEAGEKSTAKRKKRRLSVLGRNKTPKVAAGAVVARSSRLARLDTPLMGVLAGILVSAAGFAVALQVA